MATFEFGGIEALASSIAAYGDGLDELEDEILTDGGKIISDAWKQQAEAAGHRDTGAMIKHISAGKPKTDKYGYRKIEVFPRGNYANRKDKYGKKISYAKVAAVLNYGRSNMQGSNFVKKAEAAAAPKLEKLEQEKHNKLLKEKGLE